MTTVISNIKRTVAGAVRGHVHIDRFAVLEWIILLLMWAISLATLYLLWWKANPPWWA